MGLQGAFLPLPTFELLRGPLKAHLHVTVNGAAIADSPFELEINLNVSCITCCNFVCDPGKQDAKLQLSNGNRTITNTGGSNACVLGTEIMEDGKHYWEIRLDSMTSSQIKSSTNVTLGIATPQFIKFNSYITKADPANLVGGWDTSMDDGKAYGVQSAFAPALTKNWKVGDIIGWYLDFDACELSLFINKEFQGKTKVGAGSFYPAFALQNSNDAITILHDVALPAALQ